MGMLEDAEHASDARNSDLAAMSAFCHRYNYERWSQNPSYGLSPGVLQVAEATDIASWSRYPERVPTSHRQVLAETIARLRTAPSRDRASLLIAPDGSAHEPLPSEPILSKRPRLSDRRRWKALEAERHERDARVLKDSIPARRFTFVYGPAQEPGDVDTVYARMWATDDWYCFDGRFGHGGLSWGTPTEFAAAVAASLKELHLL